MKNVIALAVGISQGRGLGYNTMATVITRGLVEITRLGLALGADADTFPGLAGIGDLMATCASPDSRNHTLGGHIGRGMTLDEAIAATGGTAEGVKSCRSVLELATTARRRDADHVGRREGAARGPAGRPAGLAAARPAAQGRRRLSARARRERPGPGRSRGPRRPRCRPTAAAGPPAR